MNKEEILEKSRRENRNQDMVENEVLRDAAKYSTIFSYIAACLFCAYDVLLGKGIHYGFYVIIFGCNAVQFITKAIHLKRRHEIFFAVFFSLLTLIFLAVYIAHDLYPIDL